MDRSAAPRITLNRLFLWLVLQLVCAITAAAPETPPPPQGQTPPPADAAVKDPVVVPPTPTDNAPPKPLTLKTECVTVSDVGLRNLLFRGEADSTTTLRSGTAVAKCAGLDGAPGVLNGAGDLTIAIERANLQAFRDAKRDQPGSFMLFLNGVALPTDARVVGHETLGTLEVFRYRINQGKESQLLWSVLYADGGLVNPRELHAGLGWKADNETTPSLIPAREKSGVRVQVTTNEQLLAALVLVVLTIGVVIYLGRRGDSLRDADLPVWWNTAEDLKKVIVSMDPATRDARLLAEYPDYVAAKSPEYQALAESVLQSRPLDLNNVKAVTVGLALLQRSWKPLPASYSLSRTQLALWFTFTVSAGLFLWMLYGDLRRIDGSLLVLLGISVSTAGVSWMADRNMPDRPYTPTRGFLADLLTGFDERKQLHRYQAVIVNLLLVVVGIFHVGQQLSYPVFDASWLIFLGISGSAYGVGKGLIETK